MVHEGIALAGSSYVVSSTWFLLRHNTYVIFPVTCTIHVSLVHTVCQCTVQTDMFLCVCISHTCVEACM